jgi:hypothetical protein
MSSLLNAYDRVLAILNEEMGSSFERLDQAYDALQRRVLDVSAIGVCGYPCMGDCRTCLEAGERLEAFFAPVQPVLCSEASASVEGSGPTAADDSETPEGTPEVQIMAYAGDDERHLENMRSLDLVEEMYQNAYAYDDGYGEDGYGEDGYGEDGYDGEDYYYDDRDGYDEGGLSWNESGYFD